MVDGKQSFDPRKNSPISFRLDFFDDFEISSTCKSVEAEHSSTALQVLQTFFSETRCGNCSNWAIFEQRRAISLRRIIEDHEILKHPNANIPDQWQKTESDAEHSRYVVKQDYCKYEVFRNPKQFFPEGMLNLPNQTFESLAGAHPAAQNAFLRNLILSTGWLPEVEGSLCLLDKKTWKKQYFILRPSGLYSSSRHASKDPQHLVLECTLDRLDIYQVEEKGRRLLCAPTDSVICLKGILDDNPFEAYLACESEEMLRNWTVALRMQKYGDLLKQDYLSAVQADQMLNTTETIKDLALQEKAKARVPMDFSGVCGRIVKDQQEAVDALVTDAQGWKKRRTDRSLESPSSPTSFPLHISQPWFHGAVSREESTRLLTKQGLVDGVFLVRKSRSEPRSFVLSISHSGKVRHHRITRVKIGEGQTVLSLDEGKTKFSDLLQLIEFYQLNQGALGCKLLYPVKTNESPRR